MIEYLGEIETKFETEFENTLACLSGAHKGRIMKKMEVEHLVTHSLYVKIWRMADPHIVPLLCILEGEGLTPIFCLYYVGRGRADPHIVPVLCWKGKG